MKNCSKKGCLLAAFAVFIFLNAYGWLVHSYLLMDEYQATSKLWRSPEEMSALGAGWLVYYAALAMVVTCFFKKFRKNCGSCHCGPECACGEGCPCKTAAGASKCGCGKGCKACCCGMCFGLKLGMVMGLGMACAYLYMPIPASLAIKWFFTGLVEGLGVGVVLGLTCGCKAMGCGASSSCSTSSCSTKG